MIKCYSPCIPGVTVGHCKEGCHKHGVCRFATGQETFNGPRSYTHFNQELFKNNMNNEKSQMQESINESHKKQLGIIQRKNGDYSRGDDEYRNFKMVNHIMPWISVEEGIIIRMIDKLTRLANLAHYGHAYVTEESFEDTCDDTANYSNILKAYRQSLMADTVTGMPFTTGYSAVEELKNVAYQSEDAKAQLKADEEFKQYHEKLQQSTIAKGLRKQEKEDNAKPSLTTVLDWWKSIGAAARLRLNKQEGIDEYKLPEPKKLIEMFERYSITGKDCNPVEEGF